MCEAKSTGYPSIDKPWLKYYSTEAIHTKPAECTYIKTFINTIKHIPMTLRWNTSA